MGSKNAIMKWVMFVSFGVLVLGGLNYLIMGLVSFDFFAEIFGGVDAIASRIFYIIFGVAAVTLAAIVICKAFFKKQEKPAAPKRVTASKSA